MADLVAIVPSRGRPHAAVELARTFGETCTAETKLVFAVDVDDPERSGYSPLIRNGPIDVAISASHSMVEALNRAALSVLPEYPTAIAFMGDDHRPRTKGWDRAYLDALAFRPGIVYGNDLIQGPNLPTQCAMSTSAVQALGHMAPPVLTHLYVDNYWRDLGRSAGCITYLPHVVVEHMHPVAGKAEWDDGHRRVNDQAMYERDRAAYVAYMAEHGTRDMLAMRSAFLEAVQ